MTGWCDIYRKSHRKKQNVLVETRRYQNPVDARIPANQLIENLYLLFTWVFIHSRWLHSWFFLHQQYQPESQLLWRQGQRTNIVSLQLAHGLSVYHHKVCFESDIYNFWILIPQIRKKKMDFTLTSRTQFRGIGTFGRMWQSDTGVLAKFWDEPSTIQVPNRGWGWMV